MIWQIVDSSNIGGIEKHISVLTESLRHHGFDARIILCQNHGANPWIEQLAAAGLTARHLDGTASGLLKAMRQDRPALVHTHGYKAGILGRLCARILGIPSVSTFHMGETPKWPVNLYAAIDNATSLLSTRISVSEAIRAKLPYRSTIIPNYVQMARELPAFAEPPKRIGFVGRLSHEKAPDYFCELARRLRQPSAETRHEWHVYGDGPMRAELEAKYGAYATFHGMVTDMSAVWSNLGLCVMPSRGEGLPLASIEALGAGVPVVASNVGDLHKVIQDGTSGWLVPVHDLDGFEVAISEWMSAKQQMKQNLRETSWRHAYQNFSEQSGLPAVLQIYADRGVHPLIEGKP